VTMKFSGAAIGNLVASRRAGIGPAQESLRLYGKDRTLAVNDTELILCDGLGRQIEHLRYDDSRLLCMSEMLKDFARSVSSPEQNRLCSSGRENLMDMAVIESAYLSARTGFPEEPGRILQMASLAAEEQAGA